MLLWAVVLGMPEPAGASELVLAWTAPRDCPDREALRQGLSQRLGRDVHVGNDAPLALSGVIATRGNGYELVLITRSGAESERRSLRARSCGELARASLLIGALLLRAQAGAVSEGEPASVPQERTWFWSVRARTVSDLGSLSPISFGPGLGLGIALGGTHLELGAVFFPPYAVSAPGSSQVLGHVQLAAASLGVCQQLLRTVRLGPCIQLESGRLQGHGEALATSATASSAWWVAALGARAGVHLFGPLIGYVEAWAGLPLLRPQFVVYGVGVLHSVPQVIGRLEISLEARL